MDIDPPAVQSSAETHDTLEDFPNSPSQARALLEPTLEDRSATDRSFHSAREDLTKRTVIDSMETTTEMEAAQKNPQKPEQQQNHPLDEASRRNTEDVDMLDKGVDEDLAADEARSSSQASSPARNLVRKSSLTFAALPAREPITTKKSLGPRASRTSHLEHVKKSVPQSSLFGRITGGKSLGNIKQPEIMNIQEDVRIEVNEDQKERPHITREESDTDSKMTKLHNKSSTQRLHERINLLGKSQPPLPTKSIPATASTTQPQYPELLQHEQQMQAPQHPPQSNPLTANYEEDDDWIQPPQSQRTAQIRPQLTESGSMDVMEDMSSEHPISHEREDSEPESRFGSHKKSGPKATSKSAGSASANRSPTAETLNLQHATTKPKNVEAFYPQLGQSADASTTPIGTPASKRYVDGPLSASKTKLQSIMKTARGLFSSSAGASAQAKMETMSPSSAPQQDPINARVHASKTKGADAILAHPPKSKAAQIVTTASEARKTRSSTEKEERMKEKAEAQRQQAEAEREEVRQQEPANQKQLKTVDPQREGNQAQQAPIRTSPRKTGREEMTESQPNSNESEPVSQLMGPPASHALGRPSQIQRTKEARRPVKPAKDSAAKPKAPPVNIRVGMPSQRVPLTNAVLSSSLQETLPSNQAKQPGIIKKPSTASLQSSVSTSNLKNPVASSKPKALIAAERKKEQVCRKS